MKKIGLILLLAATTSISFASGEDNRLRDKASIRYEISQYIKCPSFITENNPTNNVKAVVRITEMGKIELYGIESENEQLREYVSEELAQLNLGASTSRGTEKFVLVIKFLAL